MTEETENNYGIPAKKLKIEIDTDKIKEEMKKLTDAESRIKELEKEAEDSKQYKEYFEKNSGKGTLPASLNNGEGSHSEGQKEFNSFPEMVEYLKKHDPETYKKLLVKGIQDFKANPHSFEYRDPWVNGVSCVKTAINKMNEKARGSQ
jgi:hypothetical protein